MPLLRSRVDLPNLVKEHGGQEPGSPGALRGWRGNAMLALIVLKDQTLFDVSYSKLWAV